MERERREECFKEFLKLTQNTTSNETFIYENSIYVYYIYYHMYKYEYNVREIIIFLQFFTSIMASLLP